MRLSLVAAAVGLALCFSLDAAAAKPKRGGTKKAPAAKVSKPSTDEATSTEAPAAATASTSAPSTRGPTRIDFDDRLIQGQTNKSGAVYLYDRKELKTRSMVKQRESFRDEIIGSVYDG